ncbi:MAG: carbohydrate ABC transporter permease [Aristaeellaceae bacterium]
MDHVREKASIPARIHRFFRQRLHVGLSRSIAGNAFSALLLCLMGAFMAMPLIYVIVSAFKPLDEFFLFPPRFFVQNPTLQNFRDLFVLMQNSWVPFTRYIFNTLFITAAGTLLHIIFASMAAYVLEKHRFPGRKLIFSFITSTLMFSPVVTWVPNMLIMNRLHLMDTYWAVLVPVIGMPLGLFLMKQFMSGIPDALIEAARIDGMRETRLFFQIVMPIVKPAWLTLMILCIKDLWNTTGSFYIRSEQLKTLPYAMNNIITSGGAARAGAGAVVGLILISVPVLVFIFCQNSIIETMASSGIKE